MQTMRYPQIQVITLESIANTNKAHHIMTIKQASNTIAGPYDIQKLPSTIHQKRLAMVSLSVNVPSELVVCATMASTAIRTPLAASSSGLRRLLAITVLCLSIGSQHTFSPGRRSMLPFIFIQAPLTLSPKLGRRRWWCAGAVVWWA